MSACTVRNPSSRRSRMNDEQPRCPALALVKNRRSRTRAASRKHSRDGSYLSDSFAQARVIESVRIHGEEKTVDTRASQSNGFRYRTRETTELRCHQFIEPAPTSQENYAFAPTNVGCRDVSAWQFTVNGRDKLNISDIVVCHSHGGAEVAPAAPGQRTREKKVCECTVASDWTRSAGSVPANAASGMATAAHASE
jgi:hypothetical protein